MDQTKYEEMRQRIIDRFSDIEEFIDLIEPYQLLDLLETNPELADLLGYYSYEES